MNQALRARPAAGIRRLTEAPRLVVDYARLATPCGLLHLFASERGLLSIALPNEPREQAEQRLQRALGPVRFREDAQVLELALEQLAEYVAGRRRSFTVPLDVQGTPFQRCVWETVAAIPYGETRSYSAVAQALGQPSAVRAVGAANGANPLPIIIPCHRVIGADGTLVGYGGGLDVKRWLLAHERSHRAGG